MRFHHLLSEKREASRETAEDVCSPQGRSIGATAHPSLQRPHGEMERVSFAQRGRELKGTGGLCRGPCWPGSSAERGLHLRLRTAEGPAGEASHMAKKKSSSWLRAAAQICSRLSPAGGADTEALTHLPKPVSAEGGVRTKVDLKKKVPGAGDGTQGFARVRQSLCQRAPSPAQKSYL